MPTVRDYVRLWGAGPAGGQNGAFDPGAEAGLIEKGLSEDVG
jgi:hypothetical protein